MSDWEEDREPVGGVAWRPYRTGRWHAWLPGARASVCGLAVTCDLDGPSLAHTPGRRACLHCRARVRRGDAPRDYRREMAEHVAGVARVPHCRCITEWPQAREHVAEPEAELALALIAWETGGGLWADVLDAEVGVTRAWEHVAYLYELTDGSHPHAPRKRG